MMPPVGEADGFQGFHGALMSGAQGNQRLAVKHGQFDVFQGGRAGQQVETLEYETQFLVPQARQLPAVQARNGLAVQKIISAGGLVEAAQHVHQRGFARTAGAHDGHKVAPLDFQGDIAHGLQLDFAGVIGLGEVAELDHWRVAHGHDSRGYCGGGGPKLAPVEAPSVAVTTASPWFNPSRISVFKPSVMPALTMTGLSFLPSALGV